MQIHNLKISQKRQRRKTIGRGGRKGTYSGRGMKGQKARSGAKINPLFEGGRSTLIDHMKKVRGFKSPHPKKVTIKFKALSEKFESNAEITMDKLIKAGFLKPAESKRGVKILSAEKTKKQFSFEKGIRFSAGVAKATDKIKKKITAEKL